METADVIVLGLGPAGASAAAEAARRGCKVIALDRKHEPGKPVQCAELVPAMIGAELSGSVRQRIDAMATFVEDDAPDVKPDFPGHMLDRAAFDAALVEAARRAGAQVRFSSYVRKISREGIVEAAGRRLSAPVIVGADGPRSRAGKAIGAVNSELVETRQITVGLLEPYHATDIFLSRGIPGGYGWLFPKGDVANLGAGVVPRHKARLKPIIARLHSKLVEEGRVGAKIVRLTGGAIPVGGMLEPYGALEKTVVLLAGDAAGLANPVTGAGIAAAVHSGRLAGQAAATGAIADYVEELEDVYRAALERAMRRRRELLGSNHGKAALRRGWIAYPEYWT
ncbi:MAG: NAD(P)/FAD-dependent oxidoreductase [Betaproteobacteria bacterium]|nr:MAG: NAD(P)/FAD-dependent oxidoreductase [Betaproteobacteria bacterium]